MHQHAKFQAIRSMLSQEMPGNHKILPVSLSKNNAKIKKISTDWDYNLISSEGGQDTSACKISGHPLHAFSGKCPETINFTHFTKSKWRQEDYDQNLISSGGGQDTFSPNQQAKFQAIPYICSPGNARKPQIWPVSLNKQGVQRTTTPFTP